MAPNSIVHRASSVESGRQPIALLINHLGSGGAQRRIAALANRFVELGRSVDVVTLNPGGKLRNLLSFDVGVVVLVPGGTSSIFSPAIYAKRLVSYMDRSKPCVLVSCVAGTHLLAVSASNQHGRLVPLILRASRHPRRAFHRWKRVHTYLESIKLRRIAWRYARADAIVAVSEGVAQGVRELLGDQPKRIETILNPVVSATLLDSPEACETRVPAAEPLVLGIGRLAHEKDFGTLLRAFAILRARRPAKLALLGSGPEERRLRTLASKLGIGPNVDMPGEVEQLDEWLVRANLVVSSSLWEGLQATPIEAMAWGCPVVVTDCPGGARETVEGGVLGGLVPIRDPNAMAEAMNKQLDDPPAPFLLAASAKRFLATGKAERYLALFDDLIANELRN